MRLIMNEENHADCRFSFINQLRPFDLPSILAEQPIRRLNIKQSWSHGAKSMHILAGAVSEGFCTAEPLQRLQKSP